MDKEELLEYYAIALERIAKAVADEQLRLEQLSIEDFEVSQAIEDCCQEIQSLAVILYQISLKS